MRIAVVGASLAGVSAAEALREHGFDGELLLIGAEDHPPYDRPPLSKDALAGGTAPEPRPLRDPDELEALRIDARLGCRAIGLDLGAKELELGGVGRLDFDALIVATGSRPVVPAWAPPLAGVHVLRTVDDARVLHADLSRADSVVVVGGGFIGCEVASVARARGLPVTIVEALQAPLAGALGPVVGEACAALHRANGVEVCCGVRVERFVGDARVRCVELSDGATIEADLVLLGVGAAPATEWLASSGLSVDDGLLCDASCWTGVGEVFAAGDVARWPSRRFERSVRVEHWTNAVEQGRQAAINLLAGPNARMPFDPVPYFWSDQYDTKLQYVGGGDLGDEVVVAEGALDEGAFVAVYARDDRATGAVAVNMPRRLPYYRQLVAQRASLAELRSADHAPAFPAASHPLAREERRHGEVRTR
jgi:NADPH-dependent 2,4-dienoyl-CoA reductase/sulfur reductase-like enzyme